MEPGLDRYSRQVALRRIGVAGQRRLLASRVAIVGCGATGTVLARYLTGAGVGRLRLIDRDCVELNNLQRQLLFDQGDARRGLPKAVAARAKLARVNSEVKLEAFVRDLEPGNCSALLGGSDLVLDGTDNLETRFLINDWAVREGIPWIYCGVLATFGHTMAVVPGKTACLRCYLPQSPAAGELPGCETEGVIGPVAAITAGLAAAAALRLLVEGTSSSGGALVMVDAWNGSTEQIRVERRPDCEVCGRRHFAYLEEGAGSRAAALCGRHAVQVSASDGAQTPPFEELAGRLCGQGDVTFNRYVLRFRVEGFEIELFRDARAIVKGTSDPATARSLYARYIGI